MKKSSDLKAIPELEEDGKFNLRSSHNSISRNKHPLITNNRTDLNKTVNNFTLPLNIKNRFGK